MDVDLEPVNVLCVNATGGTEGASQAFKTLESKLATLKGRRFYGTYNQFTGDYRACVKVEQGEDAEYLGLESWTIPGGKYARQKVSEWSSRLRELPKVFDKLASGRTVDRTRPSVEYYLSDKELVVYLPVIE